MRLPILIAALLLALCAPAAALAQGAGDEQYQDPFGDEQSQSEPTPTATATPAPTQAPVTPSQPAPAPTAAPAPSAAPSGGRQLPYTGADAGLLALAGAALVGAGLALRRAVDQR